MLLENAVYINLEGKILASLHMCENLRYIMQKAHIVKRKTWI